MLIQGEKVTCKGKKRGILAFRFMSKIAAKRNLVHGVAIDTEKTV